MAFTYVECPKPLANTDSVSIFLAGGITGCPDWQNDAVEYFRLLNLPITVYNPRRANFDTSDKTITEAQITWEFEAMDASDIVLFWFPKESVCPITLYELGRCLMLQDIHEKTVFIGVHEDYCRKEDILIQTKLATVGTNTIVHFSFDALLEHVASQLKTSFRLLDSKNK